MAIRNFRRIAVIVVLPVIAVGCRDRHPACRLDAVSLPPGITVTAPQSSLDPRLAAYAGSWEGQWNGSRASRLFVEKIASDRATVAYGVDAADDGQGVFAREGARYTAYVLPNGGLRFGTSSIAVTFTMADDLRTIHGVHETDGRIDGQVTMRRCERTFHAPTE